MGLEYDDDVFEFQCSVYDLYNRGGVIDQLDEFVRLYFDHHYLSGEYIDDLYASLDADDYRTLIDVLATRYDYDGFRDVYDRRVDDSG